MRVIARWTLSAFVANRAVPSDRKALAEQLRAWFAAVKGASWKNSAELKSQYRAASILSSDRVVFNLKGNHYRLIVAVDYLRQFVFIKWFGTHAEYDKVYAKPLSTMRSAMKIRPIREKSDHSAAVKRIAALVGAQPGTPQSDELEVLVTLVDAYEEKHHAIAA